MPQNYQYWNYYSDLLIFSKILLQLRMAVNKLNKEGKQA